MMVHTEARPIDSTEVSSRGRYRFALAVRAGLYTLVILVVTISTGAYGLRDDGIFSCAASGYGSDWYLSYCNATGYGDYDHGAIWFSLEPEASSAAASASVLFLGNSRTQFAFSNKATANWFSSLSESYYLLGFSHSENYTFEAPLLRKLRPKAKVYVVNIDSFFEQDETGPGKTVMRDESAKIHYEEKRQWQKIHKAVCTRFPAACGNHGAFYRSRSVGAWLVTGGPFPSEPVSYDEGINRNKVASYIASGQEFLPKLSANRACTILTIVPTVKTDIGTARALAAALGFELVAPELSGLVTFDQVHLDQESAERWSSAFLDEAGPRIQKCLGEPAESHVAMLGATLSNH
jgi:hypothetical protein